MTMRTLQTASIPFFLVIAFVYCEIGEYCSYRSDCDEGFLQEEDCVDNYCTCRSGYDLEYSSSLKASCEQFAYIFRKRCRSNGDCPDHSVCREPANRCECADGAVEVGKTCKRILKFKNVLESCKVYSDGVDMCNLEEKSICKSGKCVCFQKYFANTTSGKCEPHSNYLRKHGLSTYRVKPGEYCYSSSDCIEGLTCFHFKCSCPSGCTYVASKTICDCGAVPTPIGPVLLGIFLGFIIIGCWMYKINKTYEHFRAKKGSRQFTSIPLDNQDAPSPPRYNLNPSRSSDPVESSGFSAQSHPPVGLSVNNPVPTGSGRQSPVPRYQADPLPSKPYSFNNMTDYPLNPTQDTPYPADPSQGTPYPISAPVMNPYDENAPQPPPYSAAPPDAPPPYSLSPLSSGSAPPLPYPLASTDPSNVSTPQPPNLYTAPYPPTPDASATPGPADGQPVPPPYNPAFSGTTTTSSSGPNY